MAEKQQELGALWCKTSAKGEYMTGILTIEDVAIPVVAFTNQNKNNPKEPDWRILRSIPREQKENNVNDAFLPDADDELDANSIPF